MVVRNKGRKMEKLGSDDPRSFTGTVSFPSVHHGRVILFGFILYHIIFGW